MSFPKFTVDKNILDPRSFPKSKKDEKGGVKIKKNSLRGNSLFVQMAQCKIESADKFEILDKYEIGLTYHVAKH